MKIINTNSSNEDTFKYAILCSTHYYDITHHPERISKLKSLENKYNFTHNTPIEFEIDNANISLRIFDEDGVVLYQINNNGSTKAKIVKMNNFRYAAIKPIRNKSIKLNEFIKSHFHHELRDYLFENILKMVDNIGHIAEEIISPILF